MVRKIHRNRHRKAARQPKRLMRSRDPQFLRFPVPRAEEGISAEMAMEVADRTARVVNGDAVTVADKDAVAAGAEEAEAEAAVRPAGLGVPYCGYSKRRENLNLSLYEPC